MKIAGKSALGFAVSSERLMEDLSGSELTVQEIGKWGGIWCHAAVSASEISAILSRTLEIDLPDAHGAVVESHDRIAAWVTPQAWLVLVPYQDQDVLVEQITKAFPDRSLHGAAFGDQLLWLLIDGVQGEDVLKKGGFLSLERGGLPVGCFKRTLVVDIPAFIWRQEQARWIVGIERSRAKYLVDWLKQATKTA